MPPGNIGTIRRNVVCVTILRCFPFIPDPVCYKLLGCRPRLDKTHNIHSCTRSLWSAHSRPLKSFLCCVGLEVLIRNYNVILGSLPLITGIPLTEVTWFLRSMVVVWNLQSFRLIKNTVVGLTVVNRDNNDNVSPSLWAFINTCIHLYPTFSWPACTSRGFSFANSDWIVKQRWENMNWKLTSYLRPNGLRNGPLFLQDFVRRLISNS